ncbi:hypothetical protein [Plasmodium yoelii yoelii]|uniref:Uncharacterized protein n=1 Tax=Plasmodium yoelii yoelii TaxID=73239 RepID=Q7RL80_PLAYO|nr:hypothetical protein [Plasmodium yoelii yoelii]
MHLLDKNCYEDNNCLSKALILAV